MKQQPTPHRRVAALLFAAAALPFTPSLAQDMTAAPPPPVVVTPPPVVVAPPPVTTAPTPPPITMPPVTTPRATTPAPEPEARTTTRTTRAATRAPARQAAPARRAPAAAAAPEPAPIPAAEPVPVPPPVAAELPPIAEETPVPVETAAPERPVPWALIAAIIGVLAAAAALFLLVRNRRRRVARKEDVYYDVAPASVAPVTPAIEPQPYIAPYVAPAMTRDEPVVESAIAEDSGPVDATPAVETLAVGAPAEGDVAAMSAASEPEGNRPWLEMLMRPIRAGTTVDDARVEFELTVGNTGSVPARDVRISTWMFPAGAEASEMEKLLIDSEESMAPGDGTRVEAAISVPKAALPDAVLPVVVADATYRMPDGSEGRTRASFAVGLSHDGELAPFPTDRSSGLLETVEARLHGDLERD
jgi:hypothetical protein